MPLDLLIDKLVKTLDEQKSHQDVAAASNPDRHVVDEIMPVVQDQEEIPGEPGSGQQELESGARAAVRQAKEVLQRLKAKLQAEREEDEAEDEAGDEESAEQQLEEGSILLAAGGTAATSQAGQTASAEELEPWTGYHFFNTPDPIREDAQGENYIHGAEEINPWTDDRFFTTPFAGAPTSEAWMLAATEDAIEDDDDGAGILWWSGVGLLLIGGGIALSASEEEGTGTPTTTPTTTVTGLVMLGPVTAGLSVVIYDADGTELGSGDVDVENGTYEVNIGPYTGALMVKLFDENDDDTNYMDEATASATDLTAIIRGVGVVDSGVNDIQVNLTPLTELALLEVIDSSDNPDSFSSLNDLVFSDTNLEDAIETNNKAIAKLF